MTQDTIFAIDEACDPHAAPGLGTQIVALGSAACVGLAAIFGSILLGVALFVVVLVGMNVDAGSGWADRFRVFVRNRNRRVLRQILSPQ
ncbi:MAG TPA: hypothetical protein VEU28_11540 [Actinomycetota bacterium]|nr:hypothetical protein [Actinomycetota bacterium]